MTPQDIIDISRTQPLIVAVIDGMHEPPVSSLGSVTPWEAADCVNMGSMERDEICLIPSGLEAATDVALLTLLGYDAEAVGSCRAPLEALGCGIGVDHDDVVLRCNLVEMRGGSIVSHCGHEVTSSQAKNIVNILNGKFATPHIRFYCGEGFRALLKVRGMQSIPRSTPPHSILRKPFLDYMIDDKFLANLSVRANLLLSRHSLGANGVWLWGAARLERLPELGIKACSISATPLVRGLSRAVGMNVVDVEGADGTLETNLAGKACAAIAAAMHHRLTLVHVEACDEASHRLDPEAKVGMLHRVDRELVGPLLAYARSSGTGLVVLSDHATSSESGCHLPLPVPCYIYH